MYNMQGCIFNTLKLLTHLILKTSNSFNAMEAALFLSIEKSP